PGEIGRLVGKTAMPGPLVVWSPLLAVEVKVPSPLFRMMRSLKVALAAAFTRHLVTTPVQGACIVCAGTSAVP
ncbi:MAG: hypothetical protein WBM00_08250, partial [Solirubrobacterales bacterium]